MQFSMMHLDACAALKMPDPDTGTLSPRLSRSVTTYYLNISQNIVLDICQTVPSRAFRCISFLTFFCTLNFVLFCCILTFRDLFISNIHEVTSSPDLSYKSGYCSSLTINDRGDQEDQVYQGNFSLPNFEGIVFDQTDNERQPYRFCCCDSRVERYLVLVFLHYFILFAVFTFCILLPTLCENDNKDCCGILAILSACIGHILPDPES